MEQLLTWTTIIKDQIASMPRFPKTFKKTWPMGRGRGGSVFIRSLTEGIANEVAMSNNHPREAVPTTETIMARGAARAAFAVSSDM